MYSKSYANQAEAIIERMDLIVNRAKILNDVVNSEIKAKDEQIEKLDNAIFALTEKLLLGGLSREMRQECLKNVKAYMRDMPRLCLHEFCDRKEHQERRCSYATLTASP